MWNWRPVEFKAHLIDEVWEERVKAVEEKALAEVRDPIHNNLSTPEILEIAEDFKEKLNLTDEEADNLYNQCSEIIVKGIFKRKS